MGTVLILAGAMLATLAFTTPAGAADPPDQQVQQCQSALQGDPDPGLVLTTDPATGPLTAGSQLEITLSWATTDWDSIDKIFACVAVDGTFDPALIAEESPGVNDGEFVHTVTVPDADELCVNGRLSGNPSGTNETDSTHKTDQVCFEIDEQQQPQVGSVTLDKVLAGEGAPSDDPSFTFSVACDSGTVPNAAPSINASDDPLVVATDVEVGDSCTIVETGDGGADGVSLTPDEDAATAGAQVTIASDGEVINVVATNTFDETPPPPTVAPNVVTPATPAADPVQVLGTQTTRELPRTGSGTSQLFFVGLGLVLMGGGLLANGQVGMRRSS